MLALSLLGWWYSGGWKTLIRKVRTFVTGIIKSFSVPTLIRTLAAPWRQIVAYDDPNQNVQQRFRNSIDNLVSRVVGIMVRSMTIVAAGIIVVITGLVGAIILLVWPLLPLLIPVLVLKGFGLL